MRIFAPIMKNTNELFVGRCGGVSLAAQCEVWRGANCCRTVVRSTVDNSAPSSIVLGVTSGLDWLVQWPF